ncbi:unnamed protein product, partial [Anisakis simplex]
MTIPQAKSTDEGTYICETDDIHPGHTISSPPALIHVQNHEVPVIDPPLQTAMAGKPAEIHCWLPNRPYASLRWRKEEGKIAEDAIDKDGTLTIPNIKSSDEGNYICFTDDIHPGHTVSSAPAHILVEHSQVPEINPPQQTVVANQTAQINCWLPDRPYATLQWRKEDGDLSDKAVDKDGILTIPNVNSTDEGTYVCFTEDVHPGHIISSAPALIHVQNPQIPQVDPSQQTVTVNSVVRISCRLPGRPYATLQWRKEGGDISDKATDNDGVLTIPDVNISDEGTYVCFTDDVHPGHTISSAPALVHVKKPDVLVIDPPQQTVTINETAQIQCSAPNRPYVTLRWRKQDGVINENATDISGFLTIPQAR